MTDEQPLKLQILPLGGLGEIGLNMMAIAYGKDAIIIDAGVMFPDESMPGVDLVIPDIEPLLELEWNVLGVVLTHGHEDHIGALPYVLRRISAPVYATHFTMGLIENKFDEFDLLDWTERITINTDDPVDIGPFHLNFFAMCHSVADGVGLAISTPQGLIIHSGDFKIDPTPIDGRICDLEKIAEYARSGTLLLFSDSTNVERKGSTSSESMIRPEFERIFQESRGRILIATFSSNIHRMQQVLNVAEQFGRKVALLGRSMAANARIAAERGFLNIPPGLIVDIKDLEHLPDEQVTVLSTGSQGEPMSALSLMAGDRHKHVKVKPGDVMILSSRFIPGNEKAIHQIINEFARRGARVIYDKVSDVHVSGHASEDELRRLLQLVRPKCFIPVHGEYRHLLRHAQLAVEEGVAPENTFVALDGDLIEISESGISISERIPTCRVYVHGKGVGEIGSDTLRDRRCLGEVGIVVAALAVNAEKGELIAGPTLTSRGVTFEDMAPEILNAASDAVMERLRQLKPQTAEAWDAARDEVRLAIRRKVNKLLGRKPIVETLILWT